MVRAWLISESGQSQDVRAIQDAEERQDFDEGKNTETDEDSESR
jgi:hypothetical protein